MKNFATLKRILAFSKPYLHYLLLSMLFALISVSLTLYAPILIGDGVDLIVGKGEVDFSNLIPIIVKFLVVVGITALTQWLMSIFTNKIAFLTVRDIRVRAFDKLEKVPLSVIDSTPHGDLLSRITSDVEQISDGLLLGFTQLFSGVVTVLGTLIFMLFINVGITVAVVVITPLSLFVSKFIAEHTFSMFQKQTKTRGEMTAFVNEMVGNQKVVKAFCREDENFEEFERISEDLRCHTLKATFFSSLTNPSTRFINGLVYAAVGIFGALTAVANPSFTVGNLSAFLTYANQYTKPFNEISGVISELQNAFACAKRVFEIIDLENELPDKEDAVVFKNVVGDVNLKDVFFSYTPDKKLIEDLNLSVKSGQKIAIVGPTGCGKTTIINLLMRFYDVNSGEISVDGENIKNVTRNSLRQSYGMVLQETWLSTGTIRENIAYSRPDATLDEVIAAAKSAHAHSFIRRLPKGYDTVISEDGSNLSQGQKQLLCIARVMLSLPPMLILDEATSSIDARTEIRIQKAFNEMMQGRTSFIVAHRLSTIREADCILVMDKGRIIEKGTHDELIKKGGFYFNLYNSQFAVT